MSTLYDSHAHLAREFNIELDRADGEFVAKMLHGRLEQDLQDWFYERILRVFDGVPVSGWPEQDPITSELRCRMEVSCFQSIESATIARQSGYILPDKIDWFVDWSFRVNLGPGADDAKKNRLQYFWNEPEKKRIELFSAILADALPKTRYAMFYIHLYAPLLVLATKATVATAFGDHAVAKMTQAEYGILDSQLQAAIWEVQTGGGVCYIIESEKGLLTTQSSQYGKLFHIWTDQEIAERMCQQYAEGHYVSEMDYRELGSQLTLMNNHGIKYVTIDRCGNKDVRIVPIGHLIQLIQESVTNVDNSELGVAFLKGTQADERNAFHDSAKEEIVSESSNLEQIVIDTFERKCLLTNPDSIVQELQLHGMTTTEVQGNPELLLQLSIARNIRIACEIMKSPVSAHQSLTLAKHSLVNASAERPSGVPLSDTERRLAIRLREIWLEAECKKMNEPFTEEIRKDAARMVAFGERGRTTFHAVGDWIRKLFGG